MQVLIQSRRGGGRRQDGGHRRSMTSRWEEGSNMSEFHKENLPRASFFPKNLGNSISNIISQDDKFYFNIEHFQEGWESGTCPTELVVICASKRLSPA